MDKTVTGTRDHPRMCGEHGDCRYSVHGRTGSSPHVRGAHVRENIPMVCFGIIPACAGSTPCRSTGITPSRDHPRMCGEHPDADSYWRLRAGSSPHVRGAPSSALTTSSSCGIIPACAGSTSRLCASLRTRRDHPRMCGEHITPNPFANAILGSSPHVRGAPNIRPLAGKGDGIIPACAGSTMWRQANSRATWDHPRMCGEHLSDFRRKI